MEEDRMDLEGVVKDAAEPLKPEVKSRQTAGGGEMRGGEKATALVGLTCVVGSPGFCLPSSWRCGRSGAGESEVPPINLGVSRRRGS